MTSAQRILRAVEGQPWAIQREKLEAIAEVVARRVQQRPKLSAAEVAAATRSASQSGRAGSIAVLPLFGVVAQRMDMFMEYSGGTSTERFAAAFREALNDDTVTAIVLNVESPGGSVAGVPQLADLIYKSRGKKPIVAIANSLMASAAYWIGSAADSIVAAPMSFIGSIGVFTVHVDMSEAEKKEGVKVTMVSAGKFKVEGNPHEPLSEEAEAAMQAIADEAYDAFVSAVARHRGVKASDVRGGYGEGRALIAPHALAAGLVDRVATLEDVVRDLAAGKKIAGPRAESAGLTFAIESTHGIAASASTHGIRLISQADDLLALAAGDFIEDEDTDIETDVSEAGGAATEDVLTPESETAPEAEGVPMSQNDTAATTHGAATDVLAAERKRASDLYALGAAHEMDINTVQAWISNGASVEAASADILRKQNENRGAAVVPGATREHQKPFASTGEFYQAVIIAGGGGDMLPNVRMDMPTALGRLNAAATGHSATLGSEGGFMVGVQREEGLMKRAYDQSVLASRCSETPIGPGFDSLEALQLDEDSRATGSRLGGVRVYRAAEADTVTASKTKTNLFEIRLHDLMAITYLTDRETQDAPAMQSIIEEAFAEEFAFVLDDEIYRGSGAGQCQGILTAACTVSVAKETGQAADTLVAENIQKMWARVPARIRTRGVWVFNQELETQMQNMQIGTGTSAQLVYLPAGGLTQVPHAMIYGRPAIAIEQASAPGDVGDIAFVVLDQYKLASKGGLKTDESLHVRFLYNEKALRFTKRINGKPTWKSAVTPYKGNNTLSPFVTLAAR